MPDRRLLTQLTHAEEWRLYRRRLGISQRKMAKRLKVHRGFYQGVEAGEHELTFPYKLTLSPPPAQAEYLLLARRRSKLSAAAVAEKLGVTRMCLYKWEHAADPRLVKFWRGRGYRFT